MEGTSEAALNHAEGGARSAGQKGQEWDGGGRTCGRASVLSRAFLGGKKRDSKPPAFTSLTCKEKERTF